MTKFFTKHKTVFFVIIAVLILGLVVAGCYFGTKLEEVSEKKNIEEQK